MYNEIFLNNLLFREISKFMVHWATISFEKFEKFRGTYILNPLSASVAFIQKPTN